MRLKRRAAAYALIPAALVATTTSMALAATVAGGETTIETSRSGLRHGERLTLRGSGAPGSELAIEFQRAGGDRWSAVKSVETDAAGAFRTRVRARYSGSYRALTANGRASEPAPLRVRSRVRLSASGHAVVSKATRVRGRVQPAGKRAIRVRLGGRTLRTRSQRNGKFSVRYRPGSPGVFRPTVRAAGDALAAGSRDRGRKIVVYRPAHASWYGPGLYGNELACGGTLSPGTVGVAHKSLPCGTKVRFRHGKRTVTAPVVDRGPFVAGREYDLTAATKRRLGFGSTGTVLASK